MRNTSAGFDTHLLGRKTQVSREHLTVRVRIVGILCRNRSKRVTDASDCIAVTLASKKDNRANKIIWIAAGIMGLIIIALILYAISLTGK